MEGLMSFIQLPSLDIAIQSKTKTERLAMVAIDGQLVFDTTQKVLWCYVDSMWHPIDINPRSGTYFFDDFDGAASAFTSSWRGTVSGTGAALSVGNATSGYPGFVHLFAGTTTTGRATMTRGLSNYSVGASDISFKARGRVPTLSTVGDEYMVTIGLADTEGAGDHTDGAYFYYDRLTSGDFWVCKTAAAGSRTSTVTSVAVSTTNLQRFRITISGSTVLFYIDDVLVATHTTNVPSSTDLCSPCLKIEKTAGTTSLSLRMDYVEFWQVFDTRR
jgi:hypothetical protein